MQRIKYEDNVLELKTVFSDLEILNKGNSVITRWRPDGQVYLQIMDPESKDLGIGRYPKSLAKREYAIVNTEANDIDIYVPWGLVNCSFMLATKFDKEFGNLEVKPPVESLEDMRIRLEFSSGPDY